MGRRRNFHTKAEQQPSNSQPRATRSTAPEGLVGTIVPTAFPLLPLDVNSDDSVSATVDELIRLEGRIDLLVNNAGFGLAPAAAEDSSLEQAKAIFETNFFGVVRMTRAVLPHMRRQGSGRIINMGSIMGMVPLPYMALYSASKHALEGFSEALDHEVRNHGIRVSIIEPAEIRTNFDAHNVEPDAALDDYHDARTYVVEEFKRSVANGDDPTVVADVVLKAARAKEPKIRYTAGTAAGLVYLLRRFTAAGMLESVIRKRLKLDT